MVLARITHNATQSLARSREGFFHHLRSARHIATDSASQTSSDLLQSWGNDGIASQENDAASKRQVYLETYGCQMNVNDSEIVLSILEQAGYTRTKEMDKANVILINTCSIRENAEKKVWHRLNEFHKFKRRKVDPPVIGVLGCMAERLKTSLLERDKMVDVVVGPDAYRDLPRLLNKIDDGSGPMANVLLSMDETYADVTPVRTSSNGLSAYISIMRGCNNMCSFCIVPFTRGRERSRDVPSIVDEVKMLADQGYREITLLGQNVNSYNDLSSSPPSPTTTTSSTITTNPYQLRDGFSSLFQGKDSGARFNELLCRVADAAPEVRIRFTSPHPKDFPNAVLDTIAQYPNIAKQLHVPLQSGSTAVLQRMRRGYTREAYLELIGAIRSRVNSALSTDVIAGFCGETEEDHEQTLEMLRQVQYEHAYTFAYSLREKTHAHRNYVDDVPQETKSRRLQEIVKTFHENAALRNKSYLNTTQLVLVEGFDKKNKSCLTGRSDGNRVVFPGLSVLSEDRSTSVSVQPGDFVAVQITEASSSTLYGRPLFRSSLTRYQSDLQSLYGILRNSTSSRKASASASLQ